MKNMTAIQVAYSLSLVVSVKDTDTGDSFDMVKEIFYLTFLIAFLETLRYQAETVRYRAEHFLFNVTQTVITTLTVWTKITVWAVT